MMKRVLLALSLILLFAGCAKNPEVVKQDQNIETSPIVVPDNSAYESYNKWAFPDIDAPGFQDCLARAEGQGDCVGVENGNTCGGDLLSSLIVNDVNRSQLTLKKYTKDYLVDLEGKIAKYTQTNYKSDFYAVSACNLDDGMDLSIGYYWPQGKEIKNKGSYTSVLTGDMHLLLADTAGVREISDVQYFDKSATGAGTLPCSGKLVEGNIQWSCFMGLEPDKNGDMGSSVKYWLISPSDGKVIKTWDRFTLN